MQAVTKAVLSLSAVTAVFMLTSFNSSSADYVSYVACNGEERRETITSLLIPPAYACADVLHIPEATLRRLIPKARNGNRQATRMIRSYYGDSKRILYDWAHSEGHKDLLAYWNFIAQMAGEKNAAARAAPTQTVNIPQQDYLMVMKMAGDGDARSIDLLRDYYAKPMQIYPEFQANEANYLYNYWQLKSASADEPYTAELVFYKLFDTANSMADGDPRKLTFLRNIVNIPKNSGIALTSVQAEERQKLTAEIKRLETLHGRSEG